MALQQGHKIYFEKNWGLFLGAFADNIPHRHYVTQISLSLDKPIKIIDEKKQEFIFENCIIKNNVLHQFFCDSPHLSLYIYPTSAVGFYLNKTSGKENISDFTNSFTAQLKQNTQNLLSDSITFPEFIASIHNLFEDIFQKSLKDDHFEDERVKKAIYYLEENADEVISLEKISELCFISPSRFLHLFKKHTGINYRRLQLWNKISQSFRSLPHQSITETAHQYGFTDSAHYSKIFKETFGFSPKALIKK